MAKRFGLSAKLALALRAISALTLVLVLVLLERATTESFHSYVAHSESMEQMMPGAEPMVGPDEAMMGQDEQGFLNRLRLWLVLGGLGGAALAGVAGVFVAGRITRPLREIGEAADAVARGDTSRRASMPSNDELGDLAASFNQMADALARQEVTRKQFFADVAHELRTPLAVLQAEIEALQDGLTEPNSERLASLHEETALLNRLVEDLRTLSLADGGELRLDLAETAPADVLSRAVLSMAEAATRAGVRLALDLEPHLPPVIADPDRINQVVTNLLSNAIRHTPPGGEIRVRASTKDRKLQVEVRDSGSGIPAETLPRIFDRLYRAEPSRSRSSGGSGLGLAIAQQLVRAHGGEIWAANNEGGGATVAFTLPLAAAAAGRRKSQRRGREDTGVHLPATPKRGRTA